VSQTTAGLVATFSFAVYQNFDPSSVNFSPFSERATEATATISQERELTFLRDAELLLLLVLDKSVLGQKVRLTPMTGLQRKPLMYTIGGFSLQDGYIHIKLTTRKCKSLNPQAVLLQSLQHLSQSTPALPGL
jgi:hypothetical protein